MLKIRSIALSLLMLLGLIPQAWGETSLFPSNAERSSLISGVAEEAEEEFLQASEAFQLSSESNGKQLTFHWHIADGYYLYQHRFDIEVISPESAQLGELSFSKEGKHKQDPNFGEVVAYYHGVSASVPIISAPSNQLQVKVRYQGCADKGLCYIPQYQTLDFIVSPTNASLPPPEAKHQASASANNLNNATETKAAGAGTFVADENSATGLAAILAESSLITIIGLFFVLGLGLTFTPCVLPMIPILTGIIVGQGQQATRLHSFTLSTIYVIGMALTYAIAGVAAGVSGAKLQLYMQTPIVLYGFASIFVILSLSMFGFYELQLPSAIQNKLNDFSQKQKGGTYAGVAIMGILSALVVSPCVSAPLAGALLYISNSGDPGLGGMALFSLGLGMGAPLIVLGSTGGNILPKAGGWMDAVKGVFGVGLLAVALWLIKHLLPDWLEFTLWGSILILMGIYLGALNPAQSPKSELFRGIGLATLVVGVSIIFNAIASPANSAPMIGANADRSAAQPKNSFKQVRSVAALNSELKAAAEQGKPVFLDYYADWCISCIEMEHESFTNPAVQRLLNDHIWLQADLTNNEEDSALLDQFDLKGPPSMLFFNAEGHEITAARIYAYSDTDSFMQHISNLNRH